MPRSGVEARQRLQQAAIELYAERGYDGTTTAAIANLAGVNHRTFFRHFPDKREVLFDGEDSLRDSLVQSVTAAAPDLSAADVLLQAFLASTHILEDNKDVGTLRMRIIATTPALRERDLAKGATITSALAEALVRRGVKRTVAELTATVCWAAFHQAATNWLSESNLALGQHVTQAFHDLGNLAAEFA